MLAKENVSITILTADSVKRFRKLFADLKDVVKITTSTKTPDEQQLKKINEVVARLIDEYGYNSTSANELLRYVGSLLNR